VRNRLRKQNPRFEKSRVLTEKCSVSEGGKGVKKRQRMGLHLGLEKRMGN